MRAAATGLSGWRSEASSCVSAATHGRLAGHMWCGTESSRQLESPIARSHPACGEGGWCSPRTAARELLELIDTKVPFAGGVGTGRSGTDFASQLESVLPFLTVNQGPVPVAPLALGQGGVDAVDALDQGEVGGGRGLGRLARCGSGPWRFALKWWFHSH